MQSKSNSCPGVGYWLTSVTSSRNRSRKEIEVKLRRSTEKKKESKEYQNAESGDKTDELQADGLFNGI